jgi:hypothetical protein
VKKFVLVISDQADDVSFASEVAQVVDGQLKVAASAREGVEFIAQNECTAIFVDVSKLQRLREFEFEAQKQLGLFSERLQTNHIHFVSETEITQNRDAVLSPLFGNFYQRPKEDIAVAGEFYGRFVRAGEKRATQDLSHFLSPLAKVQTIEITHTNQKQEAAEAVRQYLIAAKVPARISNIITNSLDELLMNALFDAPCDEFGRPLYTATLRSQGRELKEQERVKMSIGFDGFYVGVTVADRFGSIDRNRLLTHISANYRDRDYHVKQGQAGAGLGIATVFQSGASLIYHCEAHVKTESTLLYRTSSAYREFKNQFKFFSVKFYI